MLAYRSYHPTLSEPRPPVTVKNESTEVPLDAFELDTWDIDTRQSSPTTIQRKDDLDSITPALSLSTETSFPIPSPFLSSTTFLSKPVTSASTSTTTSLTPHTPPLPQLLTSGSGELGAGSSVLSPLKSILSEWWLTSSLSPIKPIEDQHLTLKSKTEYTFNKRPLDFPETNNIVSSSLRPKSMLDQYLPIINVEPTMSLTKSTLDSYLKSNSILESPTISLKRLDLKEFSTKPSLPGPSNSFLDKSDLLSDDSLSSTGEEKKRRKPCNHELTMYCETDRTYFWRNTLLAPAKLTINTDYDLPQEACDEYCFGGYERVEIGHVYLDRYLVIHKIGWGHFSTVWLCGDQLLKRLVAIKIIKSGKVFLETAQDEISLLRDVSIVGCDNNKFDYFVKIYDQFEFSGENGKHKAIVFELLGCNLYKLTTLTLGVGVNMNYIKTITKQVLEGLVFLHEECGIIHTDIKPENILIAGSPDYHRKVILNIAKWLKVNGPWPKQFVSNWNENRDYILSSKTKKDIEEFLTSIHISRCSCDNDQFNHREYVRRLNEILKSDNYDKKNCPPEINIFHIPSPKSLRIKIADLGNACYDHTHFCDQIQTCQYRGPETILGAKYTYSADIWSLACVVFELAAGDYLFDPRPSSKGEYTTDDDHLAHMIELLGPMPEHVWKSGKLSEKFFTNDGKLRRISELNPWSITQVLEEKYDFNEQESIEFAAFLKPMLEYDPKRRVSARECLKHPWLNST